MVAEGQIVGQRYRLEKQIGAGGMGSVWLAEQLSLGTHVALKMIGREYKDHPVALARFRREARAAAEIRSPHIVQILDYDVDAEVGPFTVMELLKGEDLGARLYRVGAIRPEELRAIALQVGKALSRAHQAGVIHRDLKPENIFLCEDDDTAPLVKLLDFGVAKVRQPEATDDFRTAAGVVVGTLSRMSPEQIRGHMVDARTDVWGLGLVAFQCLVGFPPIDDALPAGQIMLNVAVRALPVPSHFNPNVPEGFDEWFVHATKVDPEQRIQTAREAVETLSAVCANPPRSFQPGTTTPQPAAPHPAIAAAATNRQLTMLGPPSPSAAVSGVRSDAAAPASADQDSFYVLVDSMPTGPVGAAALRKALDAGQLPPDAMVWASSLVDWSPLRSVLRGLNQTVGARQLSVDQEHGPASGLRASEANEDEPVLLKPRKG